MFILSVFSGMALQSWSTCFLFLCLWLSSNADEKVTICKDPDTNPLTIEISSRALQAQLNQGAYLGRCPRDADEANEEVPIVCSQMDLPVCQCPGTYNWLDGEQLCGTHCMSAEEGICYLGRETYGSPVTAQCGKWECDFGHVRCRRPDFEPVRASECGDGDLSILSKKGQVGSLHRQLLEINSESPSPSESPSASPSESPSPSEFSSPSPAECPYVCEDLPVCQCPEDYDYTSFGELCDTHCMEQDEYYCHPGSGNSLQPCRRLQCGPGQIRCRRPPANEPPRGPKDPRTFFLARGGESCDDACGAAGTVCENDLVQEAALSPAHCKDILEHLGKSVHLGGLYEDDNSGCTYYPDEPGWYQLFKRDGQALCSERNADLNRQRVCACQSLREERYFDDLVNLGDQSFCLDAGDTVATTQGRVSLAEGAGAGGAFTCNCVELCQLHSTTQSTVSLTTYENRGATNDFQGTILQITVNFLNTIAGAIFTFDASSALEIHSGGVASFTAAATFAGSGVFRAREGSTVSFSSASTFQIATEVSGQFLVESEQVSFEEVVTLTGSNALMDVRSGSRIVASRTVTVSSSSEIRGTSGTMQFDGGLSMASSSVMNLTSTTVSVSTWSASSSTMSFDGSTVTSQTWSMSSSTVTIGTGTAMSVSGGAQLDASTMTLSSSTSTFTSVQASTLTNGGTIQGRGGCNMQFTGGLQTTSSTMDLQQSTVGCGHLQMSSSTLSASSSTTVTASQVTFSQTTVQMTSASFTSSGTMSDDGGSLTFTTSTIVVTSTFTSTSSSYSLTGSSMTVTQHTITSTTITLTDVSSQFLLDGSGAGGGSLVGSLASGAVFSGLGFLRHRTGLLRLLAGSTIGCGLQLSPNAQILRRTRALQQTDLTTTNPAATACGNSIGSTTVASGASLSIDTSCSFGTESWDVAGTTSTYTTSVAATGAVDVQSGGLLVLNTVSTSTNPFSITGTFTLSGSIEVLVTDSSTTAIVILMKWDDTSCTDITSSVTVYGCTTMSCNTDVVASSAATSCYLRLFLRDTSSSDSNDAWWGLLALLALIPCCAGCALYWYKIRPKEDISYDEVLVADTAYPGYYEHGPFPSPASGFELYQAPETELVPAPEFVAPLELYQAPETELVPAPEFVAPL